MKIFLLLERYYESHLDTLIGKDLENKWCSLTSPCEYFPLQNVDDRNFAEELSFIATHRAPYLIILQKLHSELLAINEQIRKRNDFVLIHMEKSIYDNTVSIKQICIAIDLHHSSCQNLNELVDSSIAFTQLAVKYLNEYAETYLSKEKLPSINCRVNKDYEKLMPPEDFHKDFDQMIQQAINASR